MEGVGVGGGGGSNRQPVRMPLLEVVFGIRRCAFALPTGFKRLRRAGPGTFGYFPVFVLSAAVSSSPILACRFSVAKFSPLMRSSKGCLPNTCAHIDRGDDENELGEMR